jgi:phosphoribosylglycinamide formyltransferase-1
MQTTHCAVAVLISGNGTNLQALIDASVASNFKVSVVISNNAHALGLQRAARDNIPTQIIDHRNFDSRQQFDLALIEALDEINPDLIVLAGFMRILSEKFVNHYRGKILNIHPSLLPKYTGTNTHQRVLDAGEKEHGVSVHFVTEELDGGPVIAQEKIAVRVGDSAAELAARVAAKEHIVYPKVVSWFAGERLHMKDNYAYLDHEQLPATGVEIMPS